MKILDMPYFVYSSIKKTISPILTDLQKKISKAGSMAFSFLASSYLSIKRSFQAKPLDKKGNNEAPIKNKTNIDDSEKSSVNNTKDDSEKSSVNKTTKDFITLK